MSCRWKSVKKSGIPPRKVIATNKYGILVGVLLNTSHGVICEDDKKCLYHVTHWMPLPPLPKTSDKD